MKTMGVHKRSQEIYCKFNKRISHDQRIPYMNTTTHGCDHEGPCKTSVHTVAKIVTLDF